MIDTTALCLPAGSVLLWEPLATRCCCHAGACVQVFTVEMHHKRVESAGPGDNVGMNIKGLDKGNMPRAGDVMIMKSDPSLKHVEDFTAQIQVRPCLCPARSWVTLAFKADLQRGLRCLCVQTLDIPGELKAGYSPIGFVRCGRSACRVTKIDWKACPPAPCLARHLLLLPITKLHDVCDMSGSVVCCSIVRDGERTCRWARRPVVRSSRSLTP